MKETLRILKNMAMVNTLGKVAKNMKENGKMI